MTVVYVTPGTATPPSFMAVMNSEPASIWVQEAQYCSSCPAIACEIPVIRPSW